MPKDIDESSFLASSPIDAFLPEQKGARRKLYSDTRTKLPRKGRKGKSLSLCDYEEGDTEAFTRTRRERKDERYKRWLIVKPAPVALYLQVVRIPLQCTTEIAQDLPGILYVNDIHLVENGVR